MMTLKLAGFLSVVDIRTSTPNLGFGNIGPKAALYLNFKVFVPTTLIAGEISQSLYDAVGKGKVLP